MSLDINWSLLSSPPSTPSPSTPSPSPSPSPLPTSSSSFNPNSTNPDDHTSSLAASLISTLNRQLATTPRPSFIGPISVTSFDFGQAGPELEIRDIRDVWRVFDRGDEEGDADEQLRVMTKAKEDVEKVRIQRQEQQYGEDEDWVAVDVRGQEGKLDMVEFVTPTTDQFGDRLVSDRDDDGNSDDDEVDQVEGVTGGRIRSRSRPMTPGGQGYAHTPLRPTVSRSTSNRSFIPYPFDHTSAHVPTSHLLPSTPGLNHTLFSHPPNARRATSHATAPSQGPGRGAKPPPPPPPPAYSHTHYNNNERIRPAHPHPPTHTQTFTHTASPPPSPPAHPPNLPSSSSSTSSSSVPSLQLHLHLSHTSDLHLTLLTSLQVNYPSSMFMALPLKISITGFQLDAEVVMAYSGEKNRLHLTIVDDDSSTTTSTTAAAAAGGGGTVGTRPNGGPGINPGGRGPTSMMEEKQLPIGQRLLPHLQIESEIGHSDAHVLRNVGKVERFIVDVVRKTLVEELVFPNFHTIAL